MLLLFVAWLILVVIAVIFYLMANLSGVVGLSHICLHFSLLISIAWYYGTKKSKIMLLGYGVMVIFAFVTFFLLEASGILLSLLNEFRIGMFS